MSGYRSDLVDLVLQWHGEAPSGLAIFVSEDGKKSLALPKSQIEYERKTIRGQQMVEVSMPEWLAKDKGLI